MKAEDKEFLNWLRTLRNLIENGDAIVGSTPKSRAKIAKLTADIEKIEAQITEAVVP